MAMGKPQHTAHSDGVASVDQLRVTLIGDRDRSVEAALDASHRVNRLRAVSSMEPIAKQQPDLVVVGQPGPTDAGRLAEFPDVHVLAAPPDAEVIRSVVRSLERNRR